ncbi:hypothetical protein VF14_36685 [Nostoc linckia z18]|uniref:Uncharacterized protein n=2 Tax=Nostoc linckia TaxID=92942 RepID=A0A9Q5Z446_NOSLI|nr:hypothetical protein [Nostoc linckia]PHK36357.1 hypothetical protein VF13_37145 [Nostoc linckia z16]PHK39238.1 hypothetical protein VF12_14915 [Nostoc linckia z15]PHJ56162.1 hypothetical protein VF03_37820 [Nostoc linckia z2]PHJ59253.1 hypothetical protein VF02_25565 [Nostoc linckia z1]PHJ66635.1 hypothetical protein VF05_19080 [Nostoc linckia z3]
MKSLAELIIESSLLLNQIDEHPDYKALLNKGYHPDLNLGDAQTALAYLLRELDPPSIPAPKIFEIEVSHE